MAEECYICLFQHRRTSNEFHKEQGTRKQLLEYASCILSSLLVETERTCLLVKGLSCKYIRLHTHTKYSINSNNSHTYTNWFYIVNKLKYRLALVVGIRKILQSKGLHSCKPTEYQDAASSKTFIMLSNSFFKTNHCKGMKRKIYLERLLCIYSLPL